MLGPFHLKWTSSLHSKITFSRSKIMILVVIYFDLVIYHISCRAFLYQLQRSRTNMLFLLKGEAAG